MRLFHDGMFAIFSVQDITLLDTNTKSSCFLSAWVAISICKLLAITVCVFMILNAHFVLAKLQIFIHRKPCLSLKAMHDQPMAINRIEFYVQKSTCTLVCMQDQVRQT